MLAAAIAIGSERLRIDTVVLFTPPSKFRAPNLRAVRPLFGDRPPPQNAYRHHFHNGSIWI
jgi:hypothetical protein